MVGVPMHDYGCMLRAYRRHIFRPWSNATRRRPSFRRWPIASPSTSRNSGRSRRARRRRVKIQPAGPGAAQSQSDHRLFAAADSDSEHHRDFYRMLEIAFAGVPAGTSANLRSAAGRRDVDPVCRAVFLRRLAVPRLGLIGEYVGRMYLEVRRRPTYLVRAVHDGRPADEAGGFRLVRAFFSRSHPDPVLCRRRRPGRRRIEACSRRRPILAFFTHRDDPGEEVWWCSCAQPAADHGIPVYTEEELGAAWVGKLSSWRPAILDSFNYRRLLGSRSWIAHRLAPLIFILEIARPIAAVRRLTGRR